MPAAQNTKPHLKFTMHVSITFGLTCIASAIAVPYVMGGSAYGSGLIIPITTAPIGAGIALVSAIIFIAQYLFQVAAYNRSLETFGGPTGTPPSGATITFSVIGALLLIPAAAVLSILAGIGGLIIYDFMGQ
ncbi:hypothetical protein SAMN04488071_2109 [Kordiimonas lacus]|uniref:Uncharacterized protein n=2 Tax=Kordiimonas lacus TaxID=637679 RepID=A0A1G7A6B3_9PROT|nr:hypothetical protein SAMN04488071_2109 [Kordiimonas lacus]